MVAPALPVPLRRNINRDPSSNVIINPWEENNTFWRLFTTSFIYKPQLWTGVCLQSIWTNQLILQFNRNSKQPATVSIKTEDGCGGISQGIWLNSEQRLFLVRRNIARNSHGYISNRQLWMLTNQVNSCKQCHNDSDTDDDHVTQWYWRWSCHTMILMMINVTQWYWRWSCHTMILTMIMSHNDTDDDHVTQWYWRWSCHTMILTMIMSHNDTDDDHFIQWYWRWSCHTLNVCSDSNRQHNSSLT